MVISIPSRGFWFFEATALTGRGGRTRIRISIPSRGFWFFEGETGDYRVEWSDRVVDFNPLAGILVF